MIRAVLFDFSGTLVDCGQPWWDLEVTTTVRAPLTVLRKRGIIAIDEAGLERADDIYAAMRRAAWDTCIEISAEAGMRQIAETLGLRIPLRALRAAIDDVFMACLPDVVAMDGALDALHELQRRRVLMALISNARYGPFVAKALNRLGMTHFFSPIVVSADAGIRKPHPDIYLDVLRQIGVDVQDAAFVGDYYPLDIVGARAIGMHTVWMPEAAAPRADRPADAVISSLRELIPALDRLSAG
jgi:FMN phosphatase YigB (HAD superfamily)